MIIYNYLNIIGPNSNYFISGKIFEMRISIYLTQSFSHAQ